MLQFLTISDVSERLGEPVYVINYALSKHGPKPSQRLGITRLWAESDITAIQAAIEKTAANRRNRAASCSTA